MYQSHSYQLPIVLRGLSDINRRDSSEKNKTERRTRFQLLERINHE